MYFFDPIACLSPFPLFMFFLNSLLNFRLKRKAVKVHCFLGGKVFERENKVWMKSWGYD
ncbi:Hypothetical protein (plasmid) [Pseudomonas putida]|nr:Hypothetical protein [Pseudomonas putida]